MLMANIKEVISDHQLLAYGKTPRKDSLKCYNNFREFLEAAKFLPSQFGHLPVFLWIFSDRIFCPFHDSEIQRRLI